MGGGEFDFDLAGEGQERGIRLCQSLAQRGFALSRYNVWRFHSEGNAVLVPNGLPAICLAARFLPGTRLGRRAVPEIVGSEAEILGGSNSAKNRVSVMAFGDG